MVNNKNTGLKKSVTVYFSLVLLSANAEIFVQDT